MNVVSYTKAIAQPVESGLACDLCGGEVYVCGICTDYIQMGREVGCTDDGHFHKDCWDVIEKEIRDICRNGIRGLKINSKRAIELSTQFCGSYGRIHKEEKQKAAAELNPLYYENNYTP